MSSVTIETPLTQPLRSYSVITQTTFNFFDVEIVENLGCNSPHVEFIVILYIGSIFQGFAQGFNARINHNTIPS